MIDRYSVIGRLNAAVRAAGGQTAFAKQHGLTKQNVSQALSSKRPPPPVILKALNLRKVTGYVLTNGQPDA